MPLVRPWRLLPGPGEPPYPRLQGSGPHMPEEQAINICRSFRLPDLGGLSDLGCCRSRGVQVGGFSTQGIPGSIPLSRSESFLTSLLYLHGTWPPRGHTSCMLVPAGHAYPDLGQFTPHFGILHVNSQPYCPTQGADKMPADLRRRHTDPLILNPGIPSHEILHFESNMHRRACPIVGLR